MRVIEVKRVVNMTSGGKLESFSALVAVGNGNGACGFARGKSYEPGKATLVATRRAMRRLMHIPRCVGVSDCVCGWVGRYCLLYTSPSPRD